MAESPPASVQPVRRRGRTVVLLFTCALLLWNLPFGGFLMYPFKLFATWVHEMSHGVVMILSGAGFNRLEIFEDTSGLAYQTRAVGPYAMGAIASAGYVGTSLVGAIVLAIGHTARACRWLLVALACSFGASLWWIDNSFGAAFVLAAFGILLLCARFLPDRAAIMMVSFLAVQSCITAVLDIRVLFGAELVVDGQTIGASDAHTMARVSFGDHRFWATCWLVASFACFYLAVRVIMRRQMAAAVEAPAPPT